MTYKKCVVSVSKSLKERGLADHEAKAQNMCNIWAEENGVEREFGRSTSTEPRRRSFALSNLDMNDMTFFDGDEGVETVNFPVIAITSGPHEYEEDGQQQKVYIEGSTLKDALTTFKDLPMYVDHQRTPEDLIGVATDPQVIEMENGKTAVKMMATVSDKYPRGQEVMKKVKDGDMTHVSIDWFSNDIDVMGDTFATNIRPTEVSFIDNKSMDPVCKECTIETKCGTHTEHENSDDHSCGCDGEHTECKCDDGITEVSTMKEETNVKSDAENIVEREFASLRTKLDEALASNLEIESQYKEALKTIDAFKVVEEERAQAEALARRESAVDAIISKELIFGSLSEESKGTRVEELSAWDEMKLTGFSEALAGMPEPVVEEAGRTFGKGKASENSPVPTEATERKFGVSMSKDGKITLNREVLEGDN
jgi:hypothetical protein